MVGWVGRYAAITVCSLSYIQCAALCSGSGLESSCFKQNSRAEFCSSIHGKLWILYMSTKLPLIGRGIDCDVIHPPLRLRVFFIHRIQRILWTAKRSSAQFDCVLGEGQEGSSCPNAGTQCCIKPRIYTVHIACPASAGSAQTNFLKGTLNMLLDLKLEQILGGHLFL